MTNAHKAAIEAMSEGFLHAHPQMLPQRMGAALSALLAALPALGWQLVPVVATERMLDAGGKNANVQTDRGPGGSGGIYADMLAAAPKFGTAHG